MRKKLKRGIYGKEFLLHTLIILLTAGVLFASFPLIRDKHGVEADLISHHPELIGDTGLDERIIIFHENTLEPRLVSYEKPPSILLSSEGADTDPVFRVVETINTTVTGYSSTVDQTNSEPFITASGTRVRDGIIAANFLPFGTKVRIPSLFGDKVFVVKDRMNRRYSNRVDIWFSSRQAALNFGIKYTYIEVVEEL